MAIHASSAEEPSSSMIASETAENLKSSESASAETAEAPSEPGLEAQAETEAVPAVKETESSHPPEIADTATDEPIPIETLQIDVTNEQHTSSLNSSAAEIEDKDTDEGAWSTSITPIEEKGPFSLDIQHQRPPVQPSGEEEAGLSKQERYTEPELELESQPDGEDVVAGSSTPPRRLSYDNAATPRRFVIPSEPDYSYEGPSKLPMDDAVDLDANDDYYRHGDLGHSSEIEQAGLDFVDVNLGVQSGAVYGSGAALKSRTSLEIRTDSISSAKSPNSQSATSTGSGKGFKFWKKTSVGETPISPSSQSDAHVKEMPQNGATDISDGADGLPMSRDPSSSNVLSAQGRYRGRLSQPTSPMASPPIERNAKFFSSGPLASDQPDPSTGITMMVADEDGELEAVEVGGGYATSHLNEGSPTLTTDPQAGQASTIALEGQREDLAGEQEPSLGSEKKDTGRSAGPAPASEAADGDVHVRAETKEEALAREAHPPSAGGRSAGPPALNLEKTAQTSSAGEVGTAAAATASVAAATGGRSSGPVLPKSPTSPTKGHVRKPSSGPSALEKYVSRTRMMNLPPKEKTEDNRHLRDFESMMREFHSAEAKRAKEDDERQRRKEAELQEATKTWEEEILKDWRVARTGPLREVWWKGAPPSLRGRVWQVAIGNALMLPRNQLNTLKGRVAEMKTAEKWPPANPLASTEGEGRSDEDVDSKIEADVERTLPSLRLFQREGGALYDDLKEVLNCLVLARADQAAEIKKDQQRELESAADMGAKASASSGSRASYPSQLYVSGLSILCATLLLNLSPSATLIAVQNLIESKAWFRSIYALKPSVIREGEAFERVLNTLLADQLPKVYANMQAHGVRPSAYASDWVRTLFVPLLPFDVVCRLWDNIILEETDSLIYRTCIALVSLLSSRLYVPDATELTSILQGRNRAALSVWYRFLQSAPPKDPGTTQVIASLPLPSSANGSGSPPPPLPPSLSPISSPYKGDGNATSGSSEQIASQRRPSLNSPSNSNGATSAHSIEAPSSWVPRDSLFSIYSIGEENLFRAMEEQTGSDGWWKESTMERLVDRELGG